MVEALKKEVIFLKDTLKVNNILIPKVISNTNSGESKDEELKENKDVEEDIEIQITEL